MATKQRNFILFCVGVALAWYALRVIGNLQRQAEYYRQQATRAQQRLKAQAKPKPAPPAPKIQAAPAAPAITARGKRAPVIVRPKPAPSPSPFARLPGIWAGRAAIDGRGICELRFELREKAEAPEHFAGFSSMICFGSGPLMASKTANQKALALNRMNPEAAILTGAVEKGSIEFSVDKTVGADANGCAPTGFTLTPFGANQLAAEWREGGSCSGGRLILHKGRI
jgi:hypothetical protein